MNKPLQGVHTLTGINSSFPSKMSEKFTGQQDNLNYLPKQLSLIQLSYCHHWYIFFVLHLAQKMHCSWQGCL